MPRTASAARTTELDEQPCLWLNIRPDLDAVSRRVKGIFPSLASYGLEDFWIAGPEPTAAP